MQMRRKRKSYVDLAVFIYGLRRLCTVVAGLLPKVGIECEKELGKVKLCSLTVNA